MAVPKNALPPRDSDEALLLLREAIASHRGDGASLDDLRTPLSQFIAHARDEQLPPEQVLVRIKHALDVLPVIDERVASLLAIRNRIVTLAIATYYGDREPR